MFTEYSPLWIIPIAAIAVAIGLFAYYFPRSGTFSKPQRALLFSLRVLSLLLLMFLLLSPVVRFEKNTEVKPVVAFALDDSRSVVLTKDSAYYRKDFPKALDELKKRLSDKYDVRVYRFGAKTEQAHSAESDIRLDFKQEKTDIASCLSAIDDDYGRENLSAIVLCSDGIANSGNNPLNECERIQVPIYCVALGDTARRKDLAVTDIRCNRIAYLGDEFPVEITLRAERAAGSRATLTMQHQGRTLFSKNVEIKGDKFTATLPMSLTATSVGVEKYGVSLSLLPDEANRENNRADFFVEVIDSRQSVRILCAAPHPDISAIKQSLSQSKNLSVEAAVFSSRSTLSNSKPDLLIAHGMPFDSESYNYLASERESGTPILYIVSSATDVRLFNRLNAGVKIEGYSLKGSSEALALVNHSFALFSLSEQSAGLLPKMPPLNVPLARFSAQGETQTLLFQKVAGTRSDYPLLCFSSGAGAKSGVLCGENIWKWRLHNVLLNRTSEEVDELISKSVRYLVSDADKSLFRVRCDKVFPYGSDVSFEAELYDRSYRLNNTPEATMLIRREDGREFRHTFSKTMNAYSLNVGELEQGEYSYTASATLSGEKLTAKGSFVVSSASVEAANLVADHSLLKALSDKTAAEMLYPEDVQRIDALLDANEQVRPIIRTETTNRKLTESLWYWIAIVLTLSCEWFLRKFWGAI